MFLLLVIFSLAGGTQEEVDLPFARADAVQLVMSGWMSDELCKTKHQFDLMQVAAIQAGFKPNSFTQEEGDAAAMKVIEEERGAGSTEAWCSVYSARFREYFGKDPT